MSEKLRKEGEETKDGGQDEARRIINANKDIEITARKCFEDLERFLEEAAAEVNNMNLEVEDFEKTSKRIATQMEKCELQRQSFAILPCHVTQCDVALMNLLQQCKHADQSVRMDATQSVRMDSYQPARMVDNQPAKTAPVEQKVAPSKETTGKKPTDGIQKSKHEKKSMSQNTSLAKIIDKIQLRSKSTPQSSTLDESATLKSEQLSARQIRNEKDQVKKGHSAKKSGLGTSSEQLHDPNAEKNKTRNVKEEKMSKEKNTNERKASTESKNGNKKKWWHFW